MKHALNAEEYRFLAGWMEDVGLSELTEQMSPENVMISGITVVEVSDSPEAGRVFDYIEDGLTEENGYPYLLTAKYSSGYGELGPGSRLIALYAGNSRLILPGDPILFPLIGADPAGKTGNFDKSKMVRIPYYGILGLPKEEQKLLTEAERKQIEKLMRPRYGKGKQTVGFIFCVILCLILAAVLMIILAGLFDYSPVGLILAAVIALALFCAGIAGSRKLLDPMGFVRKLKYIKPVYIEYFRKPAGIDTGQIDTWEWSKGRFFKLQHLIAGSQVYFDENAVQGTIVYRVSGKEVNGCETYSGIYFSAEAFSR